MTRDLRDPKALGETLLDQAPKVRSQYGAEIPLSEIYDIHVRLFSIPDWAGDGFMSTNPANHHSKVDQSSGDLTA